MSKRQDTLNKVVKFVEARVGKGSVTTWEGEGQAKVPVTPSGSLGLDRALGCGGYPRGRIIEIFGPESSGKTTLALHALAQAQAAGGVVGFIDAEHALDPGYAEALGLKLSDLLISQPDCGEQALEICEAMVNSGEVSMIVVDSVAALTPRAEIEGQMGDSHLGLQARLMSQGLRKLTSVCAKKDCSVVFINQIRQKIGVVFGNPEVTTGGNALKFYASVRLDVRRGSVVKEGEDSVGNRTKVKVVKNKMAPPFRTCEFDIIFGHGVDRRGEVVDLGIAAGVLEKAGSWYRYGERQLGQGRSGCLEALAADPELEARISALVLGQGPAVALVPPQEGAEGEEEAAEG